MEENLDKNNEVNKEISDKANKSNPEDIKDDWDSADNDW